MGGPDLEQAILDLLDRRAPGRTVCPSDVARAVWSDTAAADDADGWRRLMDPVREAAWRLADSGVVVVTQRGETVTREGLRGPIRIGRAHRT